jgi:hypothetical protein
MSKNSQIEKGKNGLLVGGAAAGVLAFALAAPPARAADDPAPAAAPSDRAPIQKTMETIHVSAEVAAIDKSARKVTLKKPGGEKFEVQVPSDVKGFDKVKVGDRIDLDYTESLALSILPPGSAKPSATGRAASLPGAVGREVSVSAEVISVDTAHNKVTVKGPKGTERTVAVQDPDLQAKLPKLKPGQVVMITHTEAVAGAIVPTSKER